MFQDFHLKTLPEIGEILTKVRNEKLISVRDMCKQIGISTPTYYRIMKNDQTFNIKFPTRKMIRDFVLDHYSLTHYRE